MTSIILVYAVWDAESSWSSTRHEVLSAFTTREMAEAWIKTNVKTSAQKQSVDLLYVIYPDKSAHINFNRTYIQEISVDPT